MTNGRMTTLMVFKSISGSGLTVRATCANAGCGWLTEQDHPAYIPHLPRSGLCVKPDGYACCPGDLDGMGAAWAGASDERCAAVGAEGPAGGRPYRPPRDILASIYYDL